MRRFTAEERLFVDTHTWVTEPVVWSGVGQVETVLTQQQLIQLQNVKTQRGAMRPYDQNRKT